jgi:arginase
MNINLIGVPLSYGCDRDGVQNGPDELRKLGIVGLLEKNKNKVYDMGNLVVPNYTCEMRYRWHKKMKYLDPIVKVNTNLAHVVYSSLSSDSFPMIIGGDHSLGIGSIAGASKFFKELAVIWVDAHADINDFETSPSSNIHGMPLAVSMGYGFESLINIYYEGIKVLPKNVYIIGARDIDPGEMELAKKSKLNLYTMETVKEKGISYILNEVVEKIKNSTADGVHLSYDIDVFDSEIVHGTGTRVKDGFTIDEGKKVLFAFLKAGFVTSMDLVEFNPLLDDDKKTTSGLCIDICKHIGELL